MKITKQQMTQSLLKQYLKYDPMTGHFTWVLKHCNKVIPGQRAGSVHRNGHRVINLFGSLYAEHRLAWLYMTGNFPREFIDHIDHNEHNNCFANLREVSKTENNKNNSLRSDNKSGKIGIYINKRKGKNTYQVDVRYKHHRLNKAFKSLDLAIAARNAFYKKHFFHDNHGITKPT